MASPWPRRQMPDWRIRIFGHFLLRHSYFCSTQVAPGGKNDTRFVQLLSKSLERVTDCTCLILALHAYAQPVPHIRNRLEIRMPLAPWVKGDGKVVEPSPPT